MLLGHELIKSFDLLRLNDLYLNAQIGPWDTHLRYRTLSAHIHPIPPHQKRANLSSSNYLPSTTTTSAVKTENPAAMSRHAIFALRFGVFTTGTKSQPEMTPFSLKGVYRNDTSATS